MEEGIEVIVDATTDDTSPVKYITTTDDVTHPITASRIDATDFTAPNKLYVVGALDQSGNAATYTTDSTYIDNDYDLRKTILYVDAIRLGRKVGSVYPTEINVSENGIKTIGKIEAAEIVTKGVFSCSGITIKDSTTNATSITMNLDGTITCSKSGSSDTVLINANAGEICCTNLLFNNGGSISIPDNSTSGVYNYFGIDTQIGTHIRIATGGSITASAFYQESDERLKTFTEDYDINLDNLKNIKTGKFYWNEDENKVINGGVSAQSVEEYFPELVNENEEGIKTVNYDGLAVVAIAAIKKLTDRIEQLEEIVHSK